MICSNGIPMKCAISNFQTFLREFNHLCRVIHRGLLIVQDADSNLHLLNRRTFYAYFNSLILISMRRDDYIHFKEVLHQPYGYDGVWLHIKMNCILKYNSKKMRGWMGYLDKFYVRNHWIWWGRCRCRIDNLLCLRYKLFWWARRYLIIWILWCI